MNPVDRQYAIVRAMDVLVTRHNMFAAEAADTARAIFDALEEEGYVLEELDPGPQSYPPPGDLYAWLREQHRKPSSYRGADAMFT